MVSTTRPASRPFLGGVQARLRAVVVVLGIIVAVAGLAAPAVSAQPADGVQNGVAAINLSTGPAVESGAAVSLAGVGVSGSVLDDQASVARIAPQITVDPNCADHRGRIQVQGRALRQELSWSWSGPTPPTAAEGLVGLEGLWQQLPRGERRLLDQAFEQARAFIRHCAPAGCPPRGKNNMTNRGIRGSDTRVDIEIITGVAFT